MQPNLLFRAFEVLNNDIPAYGKKPTVEMTFSCFIEREFLEYTKEALLKKVFSLMIITGIAFTKMHKLWS